MDNTRDLMDFGLKEQAIAARLLSALHTDRDHTCRLGDKVSIEFNRSSGLVFLIDTDFNVAMLHGDILEDWLICPHCSEEGFHKAFSKSDRQCCKAFAKQL